MASRFEGKNRRFPANTIRVSIQKTVSGASREALVRAAVCQISFLAVTQIILQASPPVKDFFHQNR
jgi:hypothetical protein